MSKKNEERRAGKPGDDSRDAGAGAGGGMNWLPILVAVGALVLGFLAWTDGKQTKADITKRLVNIETQMGQMQTQVANAAKARPAPQQQGPDPNKVYAVKTDGAPTKGHASAPIVIAEFSDFQ